MKKSLIAGLVSMFLLFAADKASAQLNFLCDFVYFRNLLGCEMNMVGHNPTDPPYVPNSCTTPNLENTYYMHYVKLPDNKIQTVSWNIPPGFHNMVFNFPSTGTYEFWFTISICGGPQFMCNANHRNRVEVVCN